MTTDQWRKLVVKFILAAVYYSNYVNGCDSNKKLYSEIGCIPVYRNNSDSCPVAYNCENVFTRPKDKCYFNGNIYEPSAVLSKTDSALNPCLAACFCNQKHNNENVATITCAHVECPSYFTRIKEPCYFEYDKDLCCEVKTYCPEEKSIVHECSYQGTVYKKGQRIYVGDDVQCVCSETFNGTDRDASCRKLGCGSEIHHVENVLKRKAPIFFEKLDGCPIEWYHPDYDIAAVNPNPTATQSGDKLMCSYGNSTFTIGQNVTISNGENNSSPYKTTCSCNVPPLITCVRAIQQ